MGASRLARVDGRQSKIENEKGENKMSIASSLWIGLEKRFFGPERYAEKTDQLRDAPFLFRSFAKLRAIQAMSSAGELLGVTGDSIAHSMEACKQALFEECLKLGINSELAKIGWSAIAGDTVGYHRERMASNVIPRNHKLLVLHLGGNNFRKDNPLSYVKEKLFMTIAMYKNAGVKRIAWLEVPPVGNGDGAGVLNVKTITFNRLMRDHLRNLPGVDVLSTRRPLQDNHGFLKPEYDAGDHLHNTPRAFAEVHFPLIARWFKDNLE